jgi:hypothetical protein
VHAVLGADAQLGDNEVIDAEKDAREGEGRRAVVDAGRSMGGPSMELVDLLEPVCALSDVMTSNTEEGKSSAFVSSIRTDRGWIASTCRRDWWQRTIPPRQSYIRVHIGTQP